MKTIRELMKTATSLSTRSKRFKLDVQTFLQDVSAFGEANQGAAGDCVARLYNGLSGLGSQAKVKAWVEQFTPWRAVQKKDSPEFTFRVSKQGSWNLQGGIDNPWYDFDKTGDDEAKPMNIDLLIQMVHRLAANQRKKLEKGTIEVPDPIKYMAALEKVESFTIKVK